MRAMLLDAPGRPLRCADAPDPEPGPGQVLVRVGACGVCRTDLHVVDGELTEPVLPLVLGHEIAGTVVANGPGAGRFRPGERVGVPWLGRTCRRCTYCTSGRENLCGEARFTGYQLPGGYAELTVADERFCFPLPDGYAFPEAAPLLCAGLIGWRSLVAAGDAERLGLYGFGASAHIVAQVARHQGRRVFAFTKPRAAAGGTRRGDHLRAGGRAGPRGAARGGARRHGGVRGHPHERRPRDAVRAAVGRAHRPLRGQPDAP